MNLVKNNKNIILNMLNQNFSKNELLKVIKKGDKRKYNLWDNSLDKELKLNEYSNKINSNNFKITNIVQQKRKGKPVFIIDPKKGGTDYLALKKADKNLRRIYQVKQADRYQIVNQIKIILDDKMPMHLLKLDIKDFYESIDPYQILNELKMDQLLSHKTYKIIESVFQNHLIKNSGLPRGLPISATLSEIFMKKIDLQIKKTDEIYYYSRFVDDIIIITFSNKNIIFDTIKKKLNSISLTLNNLKQKEIDLIEDINSENGIFNYLGYQFKLEKKKSEISIAPQKIDKIKKRIIKSFLDYFRNNNFKLLKNRIKFLTGNCAIQKNENGFLMTGLHYTYPLINNYKPLKELDTFTYSLLKINKSRISKKIKETLNNSEIDTLLKYSFLNGYKNIIKYSFTKTEILKITTCWKYE